MSRLPWMKLWFEDLDRDCGSLSLAGRGAWMWIIGDLHGKNGERSLNLEGWSRVIRASVNQTAAVLAEIINTKTCDSNMSNVTRDALSQNSDAMITVTCRRIAREQKQRELHSLRQKRYRTKYISDAKSDASVTGIEAEADAEADAINTNSQPADAAAVDPLPSVESYQLSERLKREIAKRDPHSKAAKLPDTTHWARDIDKLIRIDGRRVEEIEAVIVWCQSNGCFWGPNILSGRQLRERFDQLWGQMQRDRGGTNAIGSGNSQGGRAVSSGPEFDPDRLDDWARK